jgi:type II secretory ATPase GspE/PulE/Tfp pilus assembly ATPase PilB-like protein
MKEVAKRRTSERQQSEGRKNDRRKTERKRCQCECDRSEKNLSEKSEKSDEILYEITDEILSEKSSVKSEDIHLHLSDSDGSSVDVTRYHYK